MADIALVSLALDSSAVVAGEKQATRALQSVDSAMQKTEKQSAQLNTGLNANVKKSGDAFKAFGDSASRAGASLSSLGGPLGRVAGEFSNLGGQIQGLIGSFGLFGGALAGAGAAAVAAGAAIVNFAVEGVRLSDELADIGEGLGFTEDQMERLNAATRLSGEQIGFLERTFGTFQQAVQSALIDKTGAAANALRRLGIEAPQAARDTQAAFLALLPKMAGVTQSFDQMTAAREVFGRGLGPLIRISQNFSDQLGLTRGQMVSLGLAVDENTNKMAGAVDKNFNQILLIWDNLKRNLILEVGPTFLKLGQDMADGLRSAMPQIAEFFKWMADQFRAGKEGLDLFQKTVQAGRQAAEADKGGLQGIIGAAGGTPSVSREIQRGFTGERFLQGLPSLTAAIDRLGKAGGGPLPSNAAQGGIRSGFGLGQPFTLQQYQDSVAKGVKTGITSLPEQFKSTAGKAGKAAREITEFTPEQIGDPFRRGLESAQKEADATASAIEAATMKQRIITEEWLEFLRILSSGVERPVPGAAPPIQTGGPGQPFPGAEIFRGLPNPKDIRTEEQARIDEQFNAIFDDMLFSVLTAQKNIGEAFGDLALGIVDTFAAEFAKAMREAFITPIIKGLTDLLVSGLKSILASVQGQLTGGGGTGFWAGLLGSILGGAAGGLGGAKVGTPSLAHIRGIGGARYFAEGGVIGAGQWGIVGERGPEYIFAGAHPATIAPMTGGGGGSTTNINFAITTPSGQVDKRTQDQIATQVYNAVKRAQRNEGSR